MTLGLVRSPGVEWGHRYDWAPFVVARQAAECTLSDVTLPCVTVLCICINMYHLAVGRVVQSV